MCIRVAKEMKRMLLPSARESRSASEALEQKSNSLEGQETEAESERHRPGPGGTTGNSPAREAGWVWAPRAPPGLWNRSPHTSTSRESLKSRLRDMVPRSADLQAKGTHTFMVWGFSSSLHLQGLPHSSWAQDCSFVRNKTGPTLHV